MTYKNRLPYNLYCVGGDVKHCSLTTVSSSLMSFERDPVDVLLTVHVKTMLCYYCWDWTLL